MQNKKRHSSLRKNIRRVQKSVKAKISHIHVVKHHIISHGRPIFSRPGRLPAKKLLAAKAKFQKMEEDGIIKLFSLQKAKLAKFI